MPRDGRCPFDPPPELGGTRDEGRLTSVRLGDGTVAWLVPHYADQRSLITDKRLSSDASLPGYPHEGRIPDGANRIGFILMDDPEHARLRRMVTAPFSHRRIRAMRPRVQELTDRLIDDMLAGPQPADLVEAFALPLPSLVICELLGVPYTEHGFFQECSRIMIDRRSSADERGAASGRLAEYLAELVQRKSTEPGDDLLTGLAERVTAGELTADDAAGIGVLLLVAGHETTANMIALGTLALLENPGQLALLRDHSDDEQVVNGAVEELLRYLTVTHNGRRRVALEDIEFADHTIRAGEGVIFPNDIGNRDPEVYDRPDDLDLTRDARHHLAFGFGVHLCLGLTLARMELQVVYGTLYRRIPTLAAAEPLSDVAFKHDGSVYGVHRLLVTW
ncbi:cytochrome P450 [Pseudonocardia phyllosphaerae]|uniref:cytochrome P450 n=1 Tax=Pseudonocardia phyllosphaerae TaxID=3390502 RepID=UPI003978DBDA